MATTITGTSGHLGLGISPSDIDSIGRSLNIASSTGGAIYLQDTDAPTTKFAAISYSGGTAGLQIHAHHSASYIDLGTNGTERLRITSDGKLGIGVSSPSTAMHLKASDAYFTMQASSSSGNAGILFKDSGGTQNSVILYDFDDDYLKITTNNDTERLRIDANGDVMFHNYTDNIGSNSSGEGFEFRRGEALRISRDQGLGLIVNRTSDDGDLITLRRDGSGKADLGIRSNALTFDVAGSERVRINNSGDVGIGANNPGADPAIGNDATVLEIRQTTSGNITSGNNRKGAVLRLKHEAQWENGYQSNSPNDDLGRVEFVTGDTSTGEGVRSVIRCRNLQYYNQQALTFEVATANSTSLEERLRIDSSGRVLIGTTTEGNSSADDLTVSTSGTTGITIRSGTSNTGNIYFSDATSGTGEFVGAIEYAHSGDSLRLHTNSNERLRIDSTGHLHIKGQDHEIRWYRDDGNRYGAITYDGGNFNIKNPVNDHTRICKSDGTEIVKFNNNKNVYIADGDLFISTAGHGIDFSATSDASGKTSELLDDYEEGTWTPTMSNAYSSVTYHVRTGLYTKVGRWVQVNCSLEISGTVEGPAIRVSGLPFTSHSSNYSSGGIQYVDLHTNFKDADPYIAGNFTHVRFYKKGSGSVVVSANEANPSNKWLGFSATYFV